MRGKPLDLGLAQRRVVVLGAGSGLGRACALEFARQGAIVTVFGRDQGNLESVAAEIGALDLAPATVVPGDLRRGADLSELMFAAAAGSGRLDVLFNNGGGPPPGIFDDLEDKTWQEAFEQTLLGYIRAIRECLPFMRAAGGGHIVNNTSSSARSALDGLILSNVFRKGVIGLTQSLAAELAADNILVNAVAPGRIDTDRVRHIDQARADRAGIAIEDVRERAQRAIPLGRYGLPAEFAKVVVFHCSAANTYVTGQTLLVDGGMYRGY